MCKFVLFTIYNKDGQIKGGCDGQSMYHAWGRGERERNVLEL
jgi:hypothetical protein